MIMSKPKKEKKIEETRKFVEMVAKKNGWKLNPDTEFIDSLIEGLTINYNRYGYYNCPCRDGDGIKEKDKDIYRQHASEKNSTKRTTKKAKKQKSIRTTRITNTSSS